MGDSPRCRLLQLFAAPQRSSLTFERHLIWIRSNRMRAALAMQYWIGNPCGLIAAFVIAPALV